MAPRKTADSEPVSNKATQRLVSILDALAEQARPLSVTDVSEATGLSPATTHRLLTSLVVVGWVDKDAATPRYRLGQAMLGVAAVALAQAPLLQFGRTSINGFARQESVIVLIAVLVGNHIVYVARADPDNGGRSNALVGMSRPAHTSSGGKVLLAFLSAEERQSLYRGNELQRFTDKTITDWVVLNEELDKSRGLGFATDCGEYREYLNAIAVPIHDASGRVVASLSAAGNGDKMTVEYMSSIRPEMNAISEELSHQLGSGLV